MTGAIQISFGVNGDRGVHGFVTKLGINVFFRFVVCYFVSFVTLKFS